MESLFTFAWKLNRSILLCLFKMFFSYQTIYRVLLKTLRKSIFVVAVSLVIFTYLAKSHLILDSIYEKTLLVWCICRYEFSFIRIILINWWKLTFLYQLFSKFWENVIWPVKAKSAISAKIFFLLFYFGNIMNMFQQKFLKLQCKKQLVRRKK